MQNSQSIFDPTGDLFFPSLYTCLALVAVIFLVGLLAELFYFRPGRCTWKKGKLFHLFSLLLYPGPEEFFFFLLLKRKSRHGRESEQGIEEKTSGQG